MNGRSNGKDFYRNTLTTLFKALFLLISAVQKTTIVMSVVYSFLLGLILSVNFQSDIPYSTIESAFATNDAQDITALGKEKILINILGKEGVYSQSQANLVLKDFFTKKHNKPTVVLVCGVNGVGKTTTIGKLCKKLKVQGNKVIVGAGDTFRAAAIDQLELWCKKINVEIIKSDIGSDPASVAFKSFEYARQNNADYCVIDTAGRLQNKKNLMEEFSKIIRVLKKIDADAPHETILVLDATTGQNAINQIEEFKKITPISGIIMTKLDGTAKGGILVAIAKQFQIPIYAIGIGEKEEDLDNFIAKDFVQAFIKN